jgi:isopenicillin N synthase-like dioxygenase
MATTIAHTTTTTPPSQGATKTTELKIINFERLQVGDKDEVQKLVNAATSRGIFFLDTSGPSTAQVTADIPDVLNAQREFFGLSLDQKRCFERSEPERGSVD